MTFIIALTLLQQPWSTFAQGAAPTAPAPGIRQLALYDRAGKMVGTLGKPGNYTQAVFSRDGTRVAVILEGDVWAFDVAKGSGTQVRHSRR